LIVNVNFQKIFRTGNSLAVTVPADFIRDLGIKSGDKVKLKVDKSKNRILLEFSGNRQLSLLGDSKISKRK